MEYPRFKGRAAIVTGSARGIGRAVVLEMAKESAGVVVNALHPEGAEAVVEEIRSAGGRAVAGPADVTDPAAVRRMVALCVETFGRVDILVNNAGGGSFIRERYLEDSSEEEWATTIDVNLMAQFHCCKAVIPLMKAQRSGRIVNLSSAGGRSRARVSNPVYCSAKAAVDGLTKQLAADLGPYGITVNAVAPGPTLTERVEGIFAARSPESVRTTLEQIPLEHRLGRIPEVAAAVLFLASDEASYITGITLDVNGGFYMG